MQLALCSRNRGDPICQAVKLLYQLHWLPVQQRITYKLAVLNTKFGARPLRFICTAESRNVSAAERYVHLPSRCWSNRTDFSRRAFRFSAPKVWNSLPQRLSLSVFLNLDLKLFYSLRLSLNADPTCRQCLWSYDRMMLYKFNYYYYYYYDDDNDVVSIKSKVN